jgi:hypothetical protein
MTRRSKRSSPPRVDGANIDHAKRGRSSVALIKPPQKVGLAADHDTAIACRIEAIQVTIAAIATNRSGCLK